MFGTKEETVTHRAGRDGLMLGLVARYRAQPGEPKPVEDFRAGISDLGVTGVGEKGRFGRVAGPTLAISSYDDPPTGKPPD